MASNSEKEGDGNRGELEIVHLTDLHLRSGDKSNLNDSELSDANKKVKALVAHIEQQHPDAHVVITGDLTDSATETSVKAAAELLQRWLRPERLSIVPGNHDCGTKGNVWIQGRKQFLMERFASCTECVYPWVKLLGPVALIGLDSTGGTRGQSVETKDHAKSAREEDRRSKLSPGQRYLEDLAAIRRMTRPRFEYEPDTSGNIDRVAAVARTIEDVIDTAADVATIFQLARRVQFANGMIGRPQLDRLAAILQLEAVRARLPIVMLHHHPWVPSGLKGSFMALDDNEELMDVLEGRMGGRPVHTVLFGHQHKSGSWEERGVRFVASPSSVIPLMGRLSFRVMRFDNQGNQSDLWDSIPWEA